MPEYTQAVYVISIAAELAGVHPQTLRIYERKGLLSPARTTGGSRRYSQADIDMLRRIQDLTNEGLNLAGVQRVLELERELAPHSATRSSRSGRRPTRPWPRRTASTGGIWFRSSRRSSSTRRADVASERRHPTPRNCVGLARQACWIYARTARSWAIDELGPVSDGSPRHPEHRPTREDEQVLTLQVGLQREWGAVRVPPVAFERDHLIRPREVEVHPAVADLHRVLRRGLRQTDLSDESDRPSTRSRCR